MKNITMDSWVHLTGAGPMVLKEIGERVRQTRTAKGFTQADWILCDCTPESRRFTDQESVDRLKKYTPAQRREMLKLMENMEEILGTSTSPETIVSEAKKLIHTAREF